MSTNMNMNAETTNIKGHFDGVKNTDTIVKPDTSTTATLNITSDEELRLLQMRMRME